MIVIETGFNTLLLNRPCIEVNNMVLLLVSIYIYIYMHTPVTCLIVVLFFV